MKKILAIIILSIFFISILGSALPEVNLIVLRMSSDQKYAITQLPSPPQIQMNKNLAKNQLEKLYSK